MSLQYSGVWALVADLHSLGGTFPFWGHPSALGLWVRVKNSLFSPSPGVNEQRGFRWVFLSSARRAEGLIIRMGSNQQFPGDPLVPVVNTDL